MVNHKKDALRAPNGKQSSLPAVQPSGLSCVCDNPWTEYERRKKELPDLSPENYHKAINEICEELGL